jgi:hypothetical protein
MLNLFPLVNSVKYGVIMKMVFKRLNEIANQQMTILNEVENRRILK